MPQYGLLAKSLDTFDDNNPNETEIPLDVVNGGASHIDGLPGETAESEDNRLFVNTNAPWSAFICGSQESGKSHTLSCMLKNALLPSMGFKIGRLPNLLVGMVFHYDKIARSKPQICEAIHLASQGIPVKVLVSSSNLHLMTKVYQEMSGYAVKPVVVPLFLEEEQLKVGRKMKLMAVDEQDGKKPLYMEVRLEVFI